MSGKLIACPNVGCRQTFLYRVEKSRHLKKCQKPPPVKVSEKLVLEDGLLECQTCKHTYTDPGAFTRHKAICLKLAEKDQQKTSKARLGPAKHVCTLCGSTFVRAFHLTRHLQSVHAHKELMICPNTTCRKIYNRKKAFDIHKAQCSNLSQERVVQGGSPSEHIAPPNNHPESETVSRSQPTVLQPLSMVTSTSTGRMTVEDPLDDNGDMDTLDDILNEITMLDESATVHSLTPDQESTTILSTPRRTVRRKNAEMRGSLCSSMGSLSPKTTKRVLNPVGPSDDSINQLIAVTSENPVDVLQYARMSLAFVENLRQEVNREFKAGSNRAVVFIAKKLNDSFGRTVLADDNLLSFVITKCGLSLFDSNRARLRQSLQLLSDNDFASRRGRKSVHSGQFYNVIHEAWINTSIPTVDRRNNRDTINIDKKEFEERYTKKYSIQPHKSMEEYTSKRDQKKYKALRLITTCTYKIMQKKVLKDHGVEVSAGVLFACKPFFCVPPTDREMELCLCKTCHNIRQLFNAVAPSTTDSISRYFMSMCECDKEDHGYYQLRCCKGQCPTEARWTSMVVNDKLVSYYQYEQVEEEYLVKRGADKGKTKTTKRTEQVRYHKDAVDVVGLLDAKRKTYMIHKFQLSHDNHSWKSILQTATPAALPIFHMDFSENLSLTPKSECQDAHFNKSQSSLHCTVGHLTAKDHQFHYHLSDNTAHDVTFVRQVVMDLVRKYPAAEYYRVKSDNCACQYKCKWTFGLYRSLAAEFGKVFIVYYGVPGHGKGLVDSMSGFGVKSPLRRNTLTNGNFYRSSFQIQQYLSKLFEEDKTKDYILLTEFGTKEEEEPLKLDSCRQIHTIVYRPSGSITSSKFICSCVNCLKGELHHCVKGQDVIDHTMCSMDSVTESEGEGSDDSDSYSDDEEEKEAEEEEVVVTGQTFEEDAVIGIQSPSAATELFYLCQIVAVKAAMETVTDDYGHVVNPGNEYLECFYLELKDPMPKKGFYCYKRLKKIAFVLPKQVFCPSVNIGNNLRLDVQEYQFLADCL